MYQVEFLRGEWLVTNDTGVCSVVASFATEEQARKAADEWNRQP